MDRKLSKENILILENEIANLSYKNDESYKKY